MYLLIIGMLKDINYRIWRGHWVSHHRQARLFRKLRQRKLDVGIGNRLLTMKLVYLSSKKIDGVKSRYEHMIDLNLM